jgi:pyruvate,water dikinase
MIIDDYTNYTFDEEADLKEVDYWIFCAADTPPGYPHTPMFDWIFMNASNWGFSYACDKLSLPNSKGITFRSYRGYEFMTVTLPTSDEEVEKRSEKFTEAIHPLLEGYDQMWTEEKGKLNQYADKFKNFNFEKATWFEIAQIFMERIDTIREMYELQHYFGEGLGAIYSLFERFCYQVLGISESDSLFQKILCGFDNDSNPVNRRLHRLSIRVDELGLRKSLLKKRPEEVISEMEKTDAGRKWVKELHDFLHIYGWRFPQQMDYITPTWIEDPTHPIIYIQQFLDKGGRFELDEKREKRAKERRKAEVELINRVPQAQRDWFKVLMKMAQKFGVWNEERAYYEMSQHAVTRYVLIEIGKRISPVGCIEKPEDTFFLVPGEIFKGLGNPEKFNLKVIVKRRKEVWEGNAKITPPPLLANVSAKEAGMLLLKSKDPMAVKVATGVLASASADPKAALVGQVASSGLAEGPARVIFSAEQLGEVQKGDILVAPATWAGWSPVFEFIQGAVIDRGGVLSDAAIVGREYGIPVVINVIDGTSKIKTGQQLKVDGDLGIVHILDLLNGKKVLIVDDEPDILETLEELLPMCDIAKASTFEQAAGLLRTHDFDLAILDIMGVEGYKLLRLANEREIVTVMLTAHALTLEDTVRSFKEGAVSYVPKDKMADIKTFLNDIFEAKEKGEKFWWRWRERFGSYYDKKFGPGWENEHKDFWKKFV